MKVTYDTAKVRDIMIQASEIMLGMGKCIEEKYSLPLLDRAMRIFDAMKRDNPSGCNEYLGALAIGEAHAEGHPWNRDNAEHFVRQKNCKLFMNKRKDSSMGPKELEDGYIAFANGTPFTSNPHSVEASGSWFAWARGWSEAFYDQQRRMLLDLRRGQDDGEDKCENWRPLGTEDDSAACRIVTGERRPS